jgi:threonine synthase
MRKEITFITNSDGLVPVAVYYDTDNNEFDRVLLQLPDAYPQITDEDLQELVDMAKANLLADMDRLFNTDINISENTFNSFLKHTKTHQSLQLIKDYKSQNQG